MSEQVETGARPQLEYAIARDRDASIGAAMAALLRRLQAGDVSFDGCRAGWAVTVVRTQGGIRRLCDRCSRREALPRSLQSRSR